MPLTCHGLHDWSLPQLHRTRRGKVVIVKVVRVCLACTAEQEVYEPAPVTGRIQVYNLDTLLWEQEVMAEPPKLRLSDRIQAYE